MSRQALQVVKCLFDTIWSIFTSWYIPGTNVTPAAFLLFMVVACLGLRFIVRFFRADTAPGNNQ